MSPVHARIPRQNRDRRVGGSEHAALARDVVVRQVRVRSALNLQPRVAEIVQEAEHRVRDRALVVGRVGVDDHGHGFFGGVVTGEQGAGRAERAEVERQRAQGAVHVYAICRVALNLQMRSVQRRAIDVDRRRGRGIEDAVADGVRAAGQGDGAAEHRHRIR